MFYLPLFHDLTDAPCLVVGGGVTAARKVRWLLRAQATVKIVATDVDDDVAEMAARNEVQLILEPFSAQHIDTSLRLVVAATDNRAVNAQVSQLAQAHNVLVNCVDQPELCTVIFPAIVDRDPIVIGISSMGVAPTLARVVRGWIEQLLAPNLGVLGELVRPFRERAKARFPDLGERMHFWEKLFRGPVAEQAMQGDLPTATEKLAAVLADPGQQQGQVALVGAGPGDPELITLKALRLIQGADVILYDKLANPAILEYARRDAELVYAGKQGPKPGSPPTRPDNRSSQQQDINAQIVAFAQSGKHVVRLKGGDPFIYGRGGEEMEEAAAADLDVIVVPGITAALGAASYAGIPLTYRNLSQSVRFVTGHRIENTVNLDWPELTREDQTLVIYMGLVGLAAILENMRAHGCEDSRPVALVEHATLPEQRVLTGTVENLARLAEEAEINGPSVVIVGHVVALRSETISGAG